MMFLLFFKSLPVGRGGSLLSFGDETGKEKKVIFNKNDRNA